MFTDFLYLSRVQVISMAVPTISSLQSDLIWEGTSSFLNDTWQPLFTRTEVPGHHSLTNFKLTRLGMLVMVMWLMRLLLKHLVCTRGPVLQDQVLFAVHAAETMHLVSGLWLHGEWSGNSVGSCEVCILVTLLDVPLLAWPFWMSSQTIQPNVGGWMIRSTPSMFDSIGLHKLLELGGNKLRTIVWHQLMR